ncbi:MAG: hypothetical protein ACLR6B_03460 [Blautia sp.]
MRNAIVIISISILALYNSTINGYRDAIRDRATVISPVISKDAHFLMTMATPDGSMDYDMMVIDSIKVIDADGLLYLVQYRMTQEEETAVEDFIEMFSSIDELIAEFSDYDYADDCGTPYEAIRRRQYNCQSASMLIKKLGDKLGLKSRILVGIYNGEPHGLVMFKKDGRSQYVDYALYREGITGLYEDTLSTKYNVRIGGF